LESPLLIAETAKSRACSQVGMGRVAIEGAVSVRNGMNASFKKALHIVAWGRQGGVCMCLTSRGGYDGI
jgi:hypothetical protein